MNSVLRLLQGIMNILKSAKAEEILFAACYAPRKLLYYKREEAMKMPELSRFAGIIIKMLYNDTVQHNKPHVHVYYGEYQASVGIDGELLAGSLPVKQLKMVVGWPCMKEKHTPHGTKLFAAKALIRSSP